MQSKQLRNSLKEGFAKQRARIQEGFAGLSYEELNWKPDDKTWSVGECLHHIWITNDKYLANLDKVIREGKKKESGDEEYRSSWLGARLIEMVGPTGGQNTPVPKVLQPGRFPREIAQLLMDQMEAFEEFITESEGTDLRRTKMQSPISKMFTFPLGDVFIALQGHNERHLNQATRIMRSAGFPGGARAGVAT
jgi:uncharacterized damage-inducible protein DinB